jgi:CBS domain containing-hemolysin-like protein
MLILALLFVFLNGFFVAAEFAIVKVRSTQIEDLVQRGSRRAGVARKIVTHLDAYLSATQLGITLASLGLGWIGEPAVAHLLEPIFAWGGVTSSDLIHTLSLSIAFAIITFLHVVVGELAPKSLAIQKPERTTLWIAFPLQCFYRLSYPIIWILNTTANLMLQSIGIQPAGEHEKAHSEAEIRMILSTSEDLSDTEKDLLDNVFTFSNRVVRQVMVPRVDIVCLYTNRDIDENMAIIRQHRHTRYPVCEDDMDHIIGILHVKDLLLTIQKRGTELDLTQKVRKPFFVPETQRAERLLRTFQRERVQLAIVIDEYGGTTGLVTLEDLLEELVGNIQDEFDQESPAIEVISHGVYRVDGGMLLDKILNPLDLDPSLIEESESDTIGGYILSRLGREAVVGETLRIGNYLVRVADVQGYRITSLTFTQTGDGRNGTK